MSTARKKNDHIVFWDPVPAEGAFTLIESQVYQRYAPEPASSSVFTNEPVAASTIPHDKMLKAAQRFMPEQSWYEEDFTNLRHPER